MQVIPSKTTFGLVSTTDQYTQEISCSCHYLMGGVLAKSQPYFYIKNIISWIGIMMSFLKMNRETLWIHCEIVTYSGWMHIFYSACNSGT